MPIRVSQVNRSVRFLTLIDLHQTKEQLGKQTCVKFRIIQLPSQRELPVQESKEHALAETPELKFFLIHKAAWELYELSKENTYYVPGAVL